MKRNKIFLVAGLLLAALVAPSVVLLDATATPTDPPTHVDSIEGVVDLLNTIMGWFYTFLGIIVVIFLLLAAFNFITAGGSEDKINKGRDMIKYAIIGIIVMLLAAGVFGIIESIVS